MDFGIADTIPQSDRSVPTEQRKAGAPALREAHGEAQSQKRLLVRPGLLEKEFVCKIGAGQIAEVGLQFMHEGAYAAYMPPQLTQAAAHNVIFYGHDVVLRKPSSAGGRWMIGGGALSRG